MARKRAAKAAKTVTPKKVKFHYIKGPDFRTVHVDGAIGGVTPQGQVHLAFYSERHAIPKVTVQAVVGGKLGDEIREERETLDGIVRQMDADLFMNEQVARQVCEWLNQRVQELQALREKKAVNAKEQ